MRHIIAITVGAAMLGGCAASVPPVDVTRFYGAAVPRAKTVAVAAVDEAVAGSLEQRSYANAVGAALARTGFSVVEPGRPAAITAQIAFDRLAQQPLARRGSPVSVGVGGSTGSYGGGLGVGIGIDLSGPPKPVVTYRLSVRLIDSASREALWEGRAETAVRDGTPAAQPGLAAGRLASALFRDYPGRSGETITVK